MGNLIDWNRIVNSGVAEFGDPRRGFAAARSGAVVCPLGHYALLRFRGDQARSFLQGQLTCDVNQVQGARGRFGGYCTPKGRLLANFVLLPAAEDLLMYVPADVSEDLEQRLRKFILRAKVSIENDKALAMMGVAGPQAPALMREELALPAEGAVALAQLPSARVVRLPGEGFVVIAAAGEMAPLWERLAQHAVAAGTPCWDWTQIRAGVPWITAATRDEFLPQMIGLDALGGVSFDKGCYTGQEIVARSHYLGEIKRRLYRGRTPAGVCAGDKLLAGGQPCGMVLNAAALPEDGTHLLAVLSVQSAAGAAVQTAGGAPVALEPAAVLASAAG